MQTRMNGWTLVKEYPRFNLWRRDKTGCCECFWKDEVPKVRTSED